MESVIVVFYFQFEFEIELITMKNICFVYLSQMVFVSTFCKQFSNSHQLRMKEGWEASAIN